MKFIFEELLLFIYVLGAFGSQSLLSILGALAVVGSFFSKSQWKLSFKNPFFWALAWILFSVFNLLLKSESDFKLEWIKNIPLILIPLSSILLGPRLIKSSRNLEDFLKRFFGLFSVLLILALGRSFYQALIQLRPATGLMSNQIYFAYSLLPFFLLIGELSLDSQFSKRTRQWLCSLAAGIALCLLLSHTRASWIVVALWFLFRALPWMFKNTSRKMILLILGAGIASIVFIFAWQPDFRNKVGRIFDSQDPSRTARAFIWKYNIELLKENPLSGIGYERNGSIPLDLAMRESFERAGLNPDFKVYAHNIFLQSLSDNGILGFMLWMAFWVLLAWSYPLLRIPMIGMGLAGLTENIFNNSRAAHPFYLLCLLCAILSMWKKERSYE